MEVTPSQLVALLRAGTAPKKARAAIAEGTLRLPPEPLLESLDILVDDPVPEIQTQALTSLRQLPAAVVRAVASARAAPELLDRLALRYADREDVLLDIARNPATGDETIARLGAVQFPAVLAAIGDDQERLHRSPEILATLLANPATPIETVRRWQQRDERRSGGAATVAPAAATSAGAPEEVDHAFDRVLLDEVDDVEAEARQHVLAGDDAPSARQLSIYALLKKMTVGQKVALAMKGNREVRNILIRENNKMLCLKVLENPRVGDSDIEAWAKSTNVPEDVLRGIANKKEWCAKYPIVKGLVCNPKAPLGVSLDFLKRFTLKDLEQLSKNRNVPEALRSAARRLHLLKRDTNR